MKAGMAVGIAEEAPKLGRQGSLNIAMNEIC